MAKDDDEKQLYALAAQPVRGIDEAKDRITDFLLSNPPPTAGERRQAAIEKTQLDANWEKVYQQTLAVSQGTSSFKPPSDKDISRARKIADDLDQMTGNNLVLQDVINAATDIMDIWGKTKLKPQNGN